MEMCAELALLTIFYCFFLSAATFVTTSSSSFKTPIQALSLENCSQIAQFFTKYRA